MALGTIVAFVPVFTLRASLCRADDSHPQSKQCELCVCVSVHVRRGVHAFGLCHIRTHCLQISVNRGSPLEHGGVVGVSQIDYGKHEVWTFVFVASRSLNGRDP